MITAIDVHAHIAPWNPVDKRVIPMLDIAQQGEIYRKIKVEKAICSPLSALYPPFDVVADNAMTYKMAMQTDWLYQWVVIDPRIEETFSQAEQMLGTGICIGIKIHPNMHGYRIRDYGDKVFSFAAKHHAIIETHDDDPENMPEEFVPFADAYPEVKLIVAHLGLGVDGDVHQVRAIQKSKQGNIYTDTSSARSLTPNLLEWAVREVGAEKILFGTDCPIYSAAMQRAHIDCADLTDIEKKLILRDNALSLFGELLLPLKNR